MIDPNCPAATLLGATLPSGWVIVEKLSPGPNPTGGNFGVPYRAERAGQAGFVKAIDFSRAGKLSNAADRLAQMRGLLDVADFEREALEFCKTRKMDRIVEIIDFDIHPSATGAQWDDVYCLVCELGEGDLRKKLTTNSSLSPACKLRFLADATRAVSQLHRAEVAHQDLKPSNVITLPDGRAKVGDLGRVVRKGVSGPYDVSSFAGAVAYRPPEYLYGHTPTEWVDHRESADCFCVGGLMYFLFTSGALSPSLLLNIPDQLKPGRGATYDSSVVAVWIQAQAAVIVNDLAPQLPEAFRDELISIFRELTHPDPAIRGHRRARRLHGRPVGLDRYADRLAQIAMHLSFSERRSRS